jgi:zinc/manganese transport system substrate-binding protein
MAIRTLICGIGLSCALSFQAGAGLSVVATTADLGSIAAEVGGKAIKLSTLAKPTEDPHFVDPKPSLVVKLRDADVLIEGGAELESGWLGPLLDRARNAKIAAGKPGRVHANDGVQMLEVPSNLDRSKGDIHAAGNPHFLSAPENAIILARHLAEVFAKLDPSSSAVFATNSANFISRLESKRAEWKRLMEPYKGQSVAGYHNAWPYFAKAFDVRIDVFLEPNPGMPPTPTHLAQVMAEMKRRNTRLIIVDSYMDRRTADTVAGRTGAKVLVVSLFPGAIKGTEGGYIELINYLVTSISRDLKAS